jgi:hypothetical protein
MELVLDVTTCLLTALNARLEVEALDLACGRRPSANAQEWIDSYYRRFDGEIAERVCRDYRHL